MKNFRLIEAIETRSPESVLVTYHFEFMGRVHQVWFRISGAEAAPSTEAFLAMALLPAMSASLNIIVESSVSQQLRQNIETIQDVFVCWNPELFHRISLAGPLTALFPKPGREVGCFFSGGVDSFYSVLKHPEEISTLLLVHGFDIKLENQPLSSAVSRAVRDAAKRLNKKVVEVDTNIRAFSNEFVRWDMYHGAVLAAVGLLLSRQFARIYIPASHTYGDLMPWGSHPLVDPLWSTEQVTFVHDGCEATRVEKVVAIAKCDAAMSNLRVCWRNPDAAYNCGECDKCLRTMVNLHLAGALGRCTTLPAKLDLKQIARTPITGNSARAFAYENLRALRASGDHTELIKAIQDALNGNHERRIGRTLKKVRRWFRKKVLQQPKS